jgi:tryptophan 7-halogenase
LVCRRNPKLRHFYFDFIRIIIIPFEKIIPQGKPVNQTEPIRIVIVGGGTAGWMTAAALSHFLESGFEIHLVESDDIGTVGVGEATIPMLNLFHTSLGIDEDAFVKATQGTFKLGIEFVDWLRPGHSYHHAFGDIGRDVGLMPFQHLWSRAHRLGKAKDLGIYSLNNMAALAGKMQRGASRTAKLLPDMPHAFHFDAGLYARFLRRFAQARGTIRTEGKIVSSTLDSVNGNIASVVMESGDQITGDFFIDCSGFRGLLIEDALHSGYEDWTQWLPCDRAWAVPCAHKGGLNPFTRSTARDAGWQWRIPLQHRIGNGYVYSSAHISDNEAVTTLLANLDGKPLADPRPLRFTTGKRKQVWKRNCLAIGLSSGFMEPLESTSIYLIQSAISRLLKMLPGRHMVAADIAEYNRQNDFEVMRIRDFLILHYKATERDDSPFWRACRDMPIPDTLAAKIELFKENGHIFREHEELFTEAGWLQVMVGQGIMPRGNHALADQISEDDLGEYMDMIEMLNTREVAQMASHADFVAAHCSAKSTETLS